MRLPYSYIHMVYALYNTVQMDLHFFVYTQRLDLAFFCFCLQIEDYTLTVLKHFSRLDILLHGIWCNDGLGFKVISFCGK